MLFSSLRLPVSSLGLLLGSGYPPCVMSIQRGFAVALQWRAMSVLSCSNPTVSILEAYTALVPMSPPSDQSLALV